MIVVDTNVIAYLVVPGARTAVAATVLEKDPDWRAPVLWHSEMLSVLTGYVRSTSLSIKTALSCFNDAQAVVKNDVLVDAAAVLELINASSCSSYDCEYVAASLALDVPLVTADKQLLRSFPEIAISMDSFLSTHW